MKSNPTALFKLAALLASAAAFSTDAFAQANWTALGGNTDWNNPGNWDIGVPAEGTNATIGSLVTADYTTPMAATSFAGLNSAGVVNVNAAGFNIDAGGNVAPITLTAGGFVNVGPAGTLVITNSGRITTAVGSFILVQNGGTFIMSNNVAASSGINLGVNGNNNGSGFTNAGGTVILDQRIESRGRSNVFVMTGGTLQLGSGVNGIFEGSNDQEKPWLINGGTASLGDFVVSRTLIGPGGGLVISNGVVTATSLRVGNNASRAGGYVGGGSLTVSGPFTICDRSNGATSGERRVQFLVRGGSILSTGVDGIVIANQSNVGVASATVISGILDVNAGTVTAEGITLVKDQSLTNAHAIMNLSGSGAIYLGTLGLRGNLGTNASPNTSYTITLSGGTLGAKDNYAINANTTVSGTAATIKAADAGGAPFNITHNGIVSGSGLLTKTGNGTLTLNTNNTYSGNTFINAGTFALGANGAINSTPQIAVAGGATFDVSAVSGYTLNATRILSGFGSVAGNVTVASTAVVNPGSNVVTGTLTFQNSVTFPGGAIAHYELSTNPSGPNNDLIAINGDVNASNTNTFEIVGGGAPGSVHKLIQYGGNFIGALSNFKVTGASGSLTNDAIGKSISLIIASSVRGPTNVTWVGNAIVNDWDVLNRTNWLNNAQLDFFVTDDNVLFNATGAANPIVNIVGNVSPSAVTVGAASAYTFGGSGSIAGAGGLTKTNTGTLTITTTNSYTGPTVINGGTVDVSTLANAGNVSGIGASGSGASSLVLDNGTLRYSGVSVGTDHAGTLNAGGGTLDVSSAATTLTLNGALTGNGQLRKAGAGMLTLAVANTHTNGTVVNAGTLGVSNAGSAGTGGITNNSATLRLNGAIVVDNVVEFNGTCNLELSGVGAGNVALRGAWFGNALVNVNFLQQSTQQTFTIGGGGAGGGSMENFSGTVNFGTNSGFLRLNNDNSTFNTGSSNATFDMGTGTGSLNQRNGGTTNQLGALIGGPNTRLAGRGNTGASGIAAYAIGGKNLSTTFEGTITNGATPTTIIKVGSATLILTGTNVHTGETIVSSGTLRIDGDNGPGQVTVDGGTLSGNGIIGGQVLVRSGAVLAPGASVGQLTINNVITLDPGAITTMELNKSAGTNDSIIGLLTVSYGGTLNVANLGGTLAEGDTFILFVSTPGTYFGAFDTINLPALPSGLKWDTSGLLVDGSIKVTAGLKFTSIIRSGTDLIMSGSNGVASGNYQVLGSTNLAVAFTNWSLIGSGVFEADGSFSFTNTISPTTPRQFYLMQVGP